MKKNIVPAAVVAILFACVAVVSFASKSPSSAGISAPAASDASVKICPHSGLPCEGDGDCGDCEGETAASDASVKICPHSGLPCEGDGDCEGDCEAE